MKLPTSPAATIRSPLCLLAVLVECWAWPSVIAHETRLPIPATGSVARVTPFAQHMIWVETSQNRSRVVVDGTPQDWFADVAALTESPDGRSLAYLGREDQGWRLVVDGRPCALLTAQSHLAFSPDGRRLAYATRRDGKYVVVLDGQPGPPLEWPVRPELVFSPDGSRLAYSVFSGRNAIMLVDGHKGLANCSQVRDAVFSPDSRHFAYVAHSVARGTQFVVLDGQKGPEFAQVMKAVFSPDGSRVAYAASDGGGWFTVVDGQQGPVYPEIHEIGFAPDGRLLIIAAGPEGPQLIVDGETSPFPHSGRGLKDVALTPDGKLLHLSSLMGGMAPALALLNGGPPRIFALPAGWQRAQMVPGGHLIAVAGCEGAYRVVVDGEEVGAPAAEVLLAASDGRNFWMPDPSTLIYTVRDGGTWSRVRLTLPADLSWLDRLESPRRRGTPADENPPPAETTIVAVDFETMPATSPYSGLPAVLSSPEGLQVVPDPRTGTPVLFPTVLFAVKPGTSLARAQQLIGTVDGHIVGGIGELGVIEAHTPRIVNRAGADIVSRLLMSAPEVIYHGPSAFIDAPLPWSPNPAERDPGEDRCSDDFPWPGSDWAQVILDMGYLPAHIDGVSVAVGMIVPGVDAGHPELAGALTPPPVLQDGPWDEELGDAVGTHLCGLIAARADGQGTTGVCPGAQLVVAEAHTSQAVAAGVVTAAKAGCKVALVPACTPWFADGSDSSADSASAQMYLAGQIGLLTAATEYAAQRGMLIVAPAGDGAIGADWNPWSIVARSHDNVLVVAAVSPGSEPLSVQLAQYSARGPDIRLAAPGGFISSSSHILHGVPGPAPGGGYQYSCGTNVAAAFTAGIAALVASQSPGLTPGQLREALIAGANAAGRVVAEGYSVLNARGALVQAERIEAGLPVLASLETAQPPQTPDTVTPLDRDAWAIPGLPADARFAKWSPTSGRLVFAAGDPDSSDIHAVALDGSALACLVDSPGSLAAPVWSPDGSRLAYQSFSETGVSLCVASADGTTPQVITGANGYNGDPCWSHDGRRLAFASSRSGNLDIWTMTPDGTETVQVTQAASHEVQPAWSPDGRWIAYVSDRDGFAAIYVCAPDGSGDRRLVDLEGDQWYPAWSPDSTRIAFTHLGDIWDVALDGSGLRRLTGPAGDDVAPAWSRDGRIAFHSNRGGQWRLFIIEPPPLSQAPVFVPGDTPAPVVTPGP